MRKLFFTGWQEEVFGTKSGGFGYYLLKLVFRLSDLILWGFLDAFNVFFLTCVVILHVCVQIE
jgi:hypothetical protein